MRSSDLKNVVKNPASAVKKTVSRYREAVGLQIEAFFKRNYLVLIGAGGVVVCIMLWRVLFGIANTFVGLSEGMAKYGFLALSTAIVAFAVSCTHTHTHICSLSANCLITIPNLIYLWFCINIKLVFI